LPRRPEKAKSRHNLWNPGNVDFQVGLAPVVALIATLLLGKADYADGGAMDYTTERHTAMTPRLNPYKAAPEAMKAMVALENYVQESGLDHTLIDLVITRASQINGCAYCIHMHTKDARARGETEERLYLLDAWRDSPLYSERERAALAWTEAVTLVSETHVPDAVYDLARQHFSETELVKLTLCVAAINAWNRIAISFRSVHPINRTRAA
jgi:AhpD family alkylhydroperoxidase